MNLLLTRGENKITVSQVARSCNKYVSVWNAFVWHIADYAKIKNYGKNWVIITIDSQAQLFKIKRIISEYDPELWENNYEVDTENELYLTHKNGISENANIIKRLVRHFETAY